MANCKAFMELISWGNGQKWYTLCYSQEHEGVVHSILDFKICYFMRKPWPTARLLWSQFPEAMGKYDTPYVSHKNMKVWSTEYWTSKLVISRESLGQLQGSFWSRFPEVMGKNDTPYVSHKNTKVWSTEYWTSKLVISRESLGQLQGFFGAHFLRQWAKMIHPMLLTRTWRCDPHNIELQNWLFQGKALANCKAFLELISWRNRQK